VRLTGGGGMTRASAGTARGAAAPESPGAGAADGQAAVDAALGASEP